MAAKKASKKASSKRGTGKPANTASVEEVFGEDHKGSHDADGGEGTVHISAVHDENAPRKRGELTYMEEQAREDHYNSSMDEMDDGLKQLRERAKELVKLVDLGIATDTPRLKKNTFGEAESLAERIREKASEGEKRWRNLVV